MLRKHYDLYDFLLWDAASVLADIGAHIVGVRRIGEGPQNWRGPKDRTAKLQGRQDWVLGEGCSPPQQLRVWVSAVNSPVESGANPSDLAIYNVFSEREHCSLYAIARPSVVCLSVVCL